MSQNVNIFVESKNAPKSQKCKINFNLFFDMGVTILEEGGVACPLGNYSHLIKFFILKTSLSQKFQLFYLFFLEKSLIYNYFRWMYLSTQWTK